MWVDWPYNFNNCDNWSEIYFIELSARVSGTMVVSILQGKPVIIIVRGNVISSDTGVVFWLNEVKLS